MRICGVICEFNPFHNGHKRLLDAVAKNGYDLTVCVMSGDFTQRGESAVTDKYTRAAAALGNGADLVLELPFPYCICGAEKFAFGGIGILQSIGADCVAFGSETDDPLLLRKTAWNLLRPEFVEKYRTLCRSGFGTGEAYPKAYAEVFGEEMPRGSNALLALAYIRELTGRGNAADILPVYRERGASSETSAGIRKKMTESGIDPVSKQMPENAADLLKDAEKHGLFMSHMRNISKSVMMYLRMCDAKMMRGIYDAGNGLSDRILSNAYVCNDFEELVEKTSGRNFTRARVRRAVLNMIFGVKEDDVRRDVSYVRLLGADAKGRSYLGEMRKGGSIPAVTKPSEIKKIRGAERQFELERKSAALWAMTLPAPVDPFLLMKTKPVFVP